MKSCPPPLDRSGHAGICMKGAQVEASESIYDKRYTIEVLHTSFLLAGLRKSNWIFDISPPALHGHGCMAAS